MELPGVEVLPAPSQVSPGWGGGPNPQVEILGSLRAAGRAGEFRKTSFNPGIINNPGEQPNWELL